VAFALLTAVAVATAPAPARADGADQVTVTGIGLAEPLEVRAKERPELCAVLYREVSWLVGEAANADEPDPDTLGPQYAIVVHIDGEERHRFHLYPLAEGGPRVFRPAEQPGERTAREGWFHGRVSMPETLSAAGVPLEGYPGGPNGSGGGIAAPEETTEPGRSVFGFLEDWRDGMLLTLAVTLAMVVGLGGVARLIRRKV
jgi:hypothetical protein